MKLNRRKAIGAVIGGTMAGPRVAQEAMAGALNPDHLRLSGSGGGNAPTDANWTADMLARARRIVSGDIRDEDRKYPTEGPPQPYRSLRSVSDDAKCFMRNRLYERQWRERIIKTARDALDHYDKTGIMRMFV